MPVQEYQLVEPDPQSPVGLAWHALAEKHPKRAARLLDAVEDEVRQGLVLSYRVLSGAGDQVEDEIEIYMVPPRYALPDTVALLRVDHRHARIEFIAIVEDYGGRRRHEHAQWRKVQQIAAKAIEGKHAP